MFFRSALLVTAFALPFQFNTQAPAKQKKLPPLQSERFARDIHDKNIGDILSVFATRAEVVTPSGKTVRGEEEIRKNYETMSSRFDTDLHLQRTNFEQTGTFGIEHGSYTEIQRDRTTGQTQESRGTYVFLHERQPNGEWHIARQKWNAGK